MRWILSMLLILVFVCGCAPQTLDSVVPAVNSSTQSSEPYTNSYYGYTLTPPTGWQVVEVAQGATVSIMEPSYEYGAMMTIELDQAVGDLDTIFADIKDKRETSNILLDTVILAESTTTVDGLDARVLEYTYYLGNEMKAREVIFVKEGNVYGIIYQAYVDNYDDFYADYESSLATFSF